MFSQNEENKKLDWMYKGPGSAVNREEYLLGRKVDKSLEQLDVAEKQGYTTNPPKNHVEHECIPPSIRDFKKQQLGEQVDLAQKLQEDPLVTIKKREEETRQKLLQNPVQLKKIQKILKNSKKKKSKSKKKHKKGDSSDSDSSVNLDKKFTGMYLKIKNHLSSSAVSEDEELDKLLITKFVQFKHLLTKADIDEILTLKNETSSSEDEKNFKSKYNSSSDSDSEDNKRKKFKQENKNNKYKEKNASANRNKSKESDLKYKNRPRSDSDSDSDTDTDRRKNKSTKKYNVEKSSETASHKRYKYVDEDSKKSKYRRRSTSLSDETYRKNKIIDKGSSDENKRKRKQSGSYGLIKSHHYRNYNEKKYVKENNEKEHKRISDNKTNLKQPERYCSKKLTEEEKEQRRLEMMKNAEWRDSEREKNVKKYREASLKESKQQEYNPEFIQKHLLKSANNSTVESRIKSNINNIQRSKSDMNAHFSRRH